MDFDLDPRIHLKVDRIKEKLILVRITLVATELEMFLFSATISPRRL